MFYFLFIWFQCLLIFSFVDLTKCKCVAQVICYFILGMYGVFIRFVHKSSEFDVVFCYCLNLIDAKIAANLKVKVKFYKIVKLNFYTQAISKLREVRKRGKNLTVEVKCAQYFCKLFKSEGKREN